MSDPVVVVGAPRTGTTLIASILSHSGVDSGLSNRPWDSGTGYYEHPLLISCYGDIKKSKLFAKYSDRISSYFWRKALLKIKSLTSKHRLLKFPMLSFLLPPLLSDIGLYPVCIVIYRNSSDYAASYYKLNTKLDYNYIKQVYLDTYRQSLLISGLFKTIFISYEDLCNETLTPNFDLLEEYLGITSSSLIANRNSLVKHRTLTKVSIINDIECNALFNIMETLKIT